MTDLADLDGKSGTMMLANAEGFREAVRQRIWNQRLAVQRQPAGIVTIRSPAEAQAAIRLARDRNMQATVRGHGHNYAAAAARDGALMLDVGPLDQLVIDPETATAWAGAAVSGGQLLEALKPHGLAFPIGHCSNVPLSGYVLSGGFGWNAGEWGPASANTLAIELVTAGGEYLHVDADNHADLFWAARGSGSGFFAAVLRYKLKLHPLPVAAFTWSATFTADSAEAISTWLDEAAAAADATAEIICLVGPDHHSGRPAIIVRASATGNGEQEARKKVGEFRDPPPEAVLIEGPAAETLGFAQLTKLSAMPNGKRVQADQLWSKGSLGEMLLALRYLAGVPDKTSSINLISPGGGTTVPGCDGADCALSLGGGAGAGIYAMWDDAAHDARHLEWVRDADAALSRFRISRYVGEADLGAGPDRVAQCFVPETLARIERLRAEWDPNNLFCGFPTG